MIDVSEGRAGAPRFTARTLLLLLVTAAGVSFLSPAASAQTPDPRSWNAGFPTTYDVTTNFLYAEMTRQSVTTTSSTHRNWGHYSAVGCTWTQVEPVIQNTNGVPTGCASLAAAPSTGISPLVQSRTISFTPTQAMIDRGGVIIGWAWHTGPPSGRNTSEYRLFHTEWVPLVARPQSALSLSAGSIGENGGIATVTATLDRQFARATTVTVTVAAVSPAVAGDFTQAGTTLTIAANATTSTGLVTVTAEDNDVDAPDKSVTVSGMVSGGNGPANPPDATLTIADDDTKGLMLAPSPLAVDVAGGGTAYTLRLATEPTGPVTVAVTSDNPEVRFAPGSLTFAVSDWSTPQTVTATASEDDDDYADTASLTHRASGGGYDGVSRRLDVAVAEAGDVRILADPSAAEREGAYSVGGVVVRIALTPLAGGAVPSASGSGFALGGDAREAVDVRLAAGSLPPSGLTICLPVSDGLLLAAAGRALLLLRYDETGEVWEEAVPGGSSPPDAEQRRVCAEEVVLFSSFSPFAVGYRDERPEFAPRDKLALVFTVDEEIAPEVLPAATGGDGGLTYSIREVLPDGLRFDGPTRTLSGTPTVEQAAADYTLVATDVDGQPAELEFSIEVESALPAARERLAAVNRSVLPELSRAMWGSALDAIGARLQAGPGGGSSAGGAMEQGLAAAAGFLRSKGEALEDGERSWRELVGGESFALALGGDGEGEGSGGGGSAMVMWGGGDWRDLSREHGTLSWSGKLFSAHVGADVALGGGMMGGVAVSRFESAIGYTDRSDAGKGAIEGDHEQRMVAVHPYLGWSGAAGERLWAALGYGHGEVRMADAAIFERYGWQESDGRLLAGALGGAVPVYGDGETSVEVRASAEATRYVLADNGEAIAGLSVSTRRLRLAAAGGWNWALRGGRLLEPSLEAGLRWDGGDGATGVGVELGAGLAWSDAAAGLSASVTGRSLVAHGGDLEEWGASGSLHMDAGGDGRGLALSLTPAWGEAGSGLARLWEEGMTARDGDAGAAGGGRLEGELGYGLAAWGEAATVTPYGGVTLGANERRYSLGQRLALGEALGLEIEASRSERSKAGYGLGVELRMNW